MTSSDRREAARGGFGPSVARGAGLATGVLCVHGSGFGMDPGEGYFRMVFLAPPSQLNEIWDLIGEFNKTFLAR